MHGIVFFGSFQEYSAIVLDRLHRSKDFRVLAAVTTPPAPKGRHLHLTKNETQIYSEGHNIPCYPMNNLDHVLALQTDFIVVAGYGRLIPDPWLKLPKIMPLNLHQSLLPDYAGRCPAEWAILNGEKETGVTLIRMTDKFDAGDILARESVPVTDKDNRLTLYQKLYTRGADLLIRTLPEIAAGKIKPKSQISNLKSLTYARQITRQDGFIEYSCFVKALEDLHSEHTQRNRVEPQARTGSSSMRDCRSEELDRKFRAFYGWPGVWTTDPSGTRIKLVALEPEILIQKAGKKPEIYRS